MATGQYYKAVLIIEVYEMSVVFPILEILQFQMVLMNGR